MSPLPVRDKTRLLAQCGGPGPVEGGRFFGVRLTRICYWKAKTGRFRKFNGFRRLGGFSFRIKEKGGLLVDIYRDVRYRLEPLDS